VTNVIGEPCADIMDRACADEWETRASSPYDCRAVTSRWDRPAALPGSAPQARTPTWSPPAPSARQQRKD
jgi:hypothetical protein